jgi:GNAT superfamily N-acetyltransferase
MDRQTFETAVFRKWADRYNCTIEDLKRPGTEIIPEDDFANSNAIHIWTIGERAFARMDPACEELAHRALAAQPESTALTADHVAAAVTSHSIRKIEDNLLFYLHPPEFRPVPTAKEFVLQQLTQDDVGALSALQAACAAAEAEEAEVSVEDEIGFGCFSGTQLVSIATGFRLTGFMDIGVLTHPGYRRRKLGKACVSALCRWCIDNHVIAQYRCRAKNTGSRSIAEGLSFDLFFTQQSVHLTSTRSNPNQ